MHHSRPFHIYDNAEIENYNWMELVLRKIGPPGMLTQLTAKSAYFDITNLKVLKRRNNILPT